MNDRSATEQDLKWTKYLATELRYWLATEQSLKLTTNMTFNSFAWLSFNLALYNCSQLV